MGNNVSIIKTTETCWNCKGRGWVDTFRVDGKYLGREECTVCGGQGDWPLIIHEAS